MTAEKGKLLPGCQSLNLINRLLCHPPYLLPYFRAWLIPTLLSRNPMANSKSHLMATLSNLQAPPTTSKVPTTYFFPHQPVLYHPTQFLSKFTKDFVRGPPYPNPIRMSRTAKLLSWMRTTTRLTGRTTHEICRPITAMKTSAAIGPYRLRCKRSEEHTSELQSHLNLVCRLLLEKKKQKNTLTLSIQQRSKKQNTSH